MCGIGGIVDLKKAGRIRPDYLEDMASLLRHRGPDEEGNFTSKDDNIAFFNMRLKIIDLESGRQPIFNEDKTISVVLNGEIYNYKELRDELIGKGHRFATQSDTETITHLYEERGIDFPKYLDGMFALILWDFRKNVGYLCRDRLGKKPLYYYRDGDWFVVASELRAILRSGIDNLDFSVDSDSLSQFFTFGMTVGRNSIIRNVKKVPPATLLKFDYQNRELKEERYWEIPPLENPPGRDLKKVVEDFAALFEDSVKKRFVADVKVGAFLSGGVDSTAVVATARHLGYDVDTYTIGFVKDAYDELPYASRIAKVLNIRNESITLDREITKHDVIDVMSRFDEPFYDQSGVPTYFLSKMVASELKVVLSGDGGDESLMGYTHYDQYYNYPDFFMKKIPPGATKYLNNIKASYWDRIFVKRFSRLNPYYFKRIFKTPVKDRRKDIKWILGRYKSRDFFDLMSKLDLHLYLVDDILVKVDRMSMQNSLEVRCPFLDYKLVEYLAKIPSSAKMGYGNNKKYILKEYIRERFKDYPEIYDIIDRKKHGFSFPIEKYIDEMEPEVYKWLGDENFAAYFGLEEKVIDDILADYFKLGKKRGGKSLRHILCLYWWWDKNREVLN